MSDDLDAIDEGLNRLALRHDYGLFVAAVRRLRVALVEAEREQAAADSQIDALLRMNEATMTRLDNRTVELVEAERARDEFNRSMVATADSLEDMRERAQAAEQRLHGYIHTKVQLASVSGQRDDLKSRLAEAERQRDAALAIGWYGPLDDPAPVAYINGWNDCLRQIRAALGAASDTPEGRAMKWSEAVSDEEPVTWKDIANAIKAVPPR